AADLARQVDSLKDLIGKLEAGLDSATRAAHVAARAAEEGRPDIAALNDPGRLAPAVAFASTRGHLRLPVNGVRIREFGASDGLGGTQKGLSIAARAGAQITSPCDGWVVYAGPFRSYGQLLILNAGGGYHVLLAGMERISVDLGQFVLTGEPVAVMGGGSQVSAAVAIRSMQPVLYVEFRSIQARGGQQTKVKRFADDAQNFPHFPRRNRRCRAHAAGNAATHCTCRIDRKSGLVGHLPPT